MLGTNPGYKARFGQFTTLLRQGQTAEAAFTNALRTSFPALEAELRAYLAGARFPPWQFVLTQDLNASRVFVTRGLSQAEVYFHLGDELLRIGRPEAAAPFFKKARAIAPRSPLGFEGLGILAAEQNDSAEAVQLFQEAFDRGSKNFLAMYLYAQEKYRRISMQPEVNPALSKENAVDIRNRLESSLKLMPDFGPAHHLLGFVLMAQGEDFPSAEQHLQRAIQLEPENQAYLLSLAQVQLIRKGPEAARRTLEPLLLPNVQSDIRAHAQQFLEEIERMPDKARPFSPEPKTSRPASR